jgi:hypothetical protein
LGFNCSKCLHLYRKSIALTLQGVNTAEAQIRQILHHDENRTDKSYTTGYPVEAVRAVAGLGDWGSGGQGIFLYRAVISLPMEMLKPYTPLLPTDQTRTVLDDLLDLVLDCLLDTAGQRWMRLWEIRNGDGDTSHENYNANVARVIVCLKYSMMVLVQDVAWSFNKLLAAGNPVVACTPFQSPQFNAFRVALLQTANSTQARRDEYRAQPFRVINLDLVNVVSTLDSQQQGIMQTQQSILQSLAAQQAQQQSIVQQMAHQNQMLAQLLQMQSGALPPPLLGATRMPLPSPSPFIAAAMEGGTTTASASAAAPSRSTTTPAAMGTVAPQRRSAFGSGVTPRAATASGGSSVAQLSASNGAVGKAPEPPGPNQHNTFCAIKASTAPAHGGGQSGGRSVGMVSASVGAMDAFACAATGDGHGRQKLLNGRPTPSPLPIGESFGGLLNAGQVYTIERLTHNAQRPSPIPILGHARFRPQPRDLVASRAISPHPQVLHDTRIGIASQQCHIAPLDPHKWPVEVPSWALERKIDVQVVNSLKQLWMQYSERTIDGPALQLIER